MFPAGLGELAVMGNSGFVAVMLEMRELETTARTLGLKIVTLGMGGAEDIVPAFEALKGRVQALLSVPIQPQPPTGFESSL